jgi:VWFA-related protein
MKTALERIDARGSTALYDAVIGSLDHLKKGARDKKVILVVTDGEDNASRHSLANAVEQAQRNDALIYAVGLFSDDDIKHNRSAMKKARGALSELANATGGLAFFPEDASDTEAICTQIAHDIRNQYTLAYYPTNAARDGSFRAVQVQVTPPKGSGKLSVRTRTGYYAPRAPSSGN